VHCGKRGSDPDAVCHLRSDEFTDEADSGIWGSVHGKGYFWGRIWVAPLKPTGTLRHTCATVPQPSKMRFGVVRAVGPDIAVLDGGPRRTRGRGGFGGFVPHFHNGKCHLVADGEMFPIRMRKLHNVSVRQM